MPGEVPRYRDFSPVLIHEGTSRPGPRHADVIVTVTIIKVIGISVSNPFALRSQDDRTRCKGPDVIEIKGVISFDLSLHLDQCLRSRPGEKLRGIRAIEKHPQDRAPSFLTNVTVNETVEPSSDSLVSKLRLEADCRLTSLWPLKTSEECARHSDRISGAFGHDYYCQFMIHQGPLSVARPLWDGRGECFSSQTCMPGGFAPAALCDAC